MWEYTVVTVLAAACQDTLSQFVSCFPCCEWQESGQGIQDTTPQQQKEEESYLLKGSTAK